MKKLFAKMLIAIVWRLKWEEFFHLTGYMNRWWLRKHGTEFPKRRWSCRVHQILRSDNDRHRHDHPWIWYLTIILKGGYWEDTEAGCKWYGPGSILFRRHHHTHRLILPEGKDCWTLFFMGRWMQTWGFYTAEGKIPWREYLEQ